jgi:hypothetical protein
MSKKTAEGRGADGHKPGESYPDTPDGRYFVVRGRLWRKSNPDLEPARREQLVKDLMSARRDVRTFRHDRDNLALARERVDAAKVALGERGPVWWNDGTPDYNRHMAVNSPYADWFSQLDED